MAKKKLTRSKVVKKLDAVFSQYIRLRESVMGFSTCFTCGKEDNWKKLQNGHFMSRKHYSTRWDETNCQVQCAGCNVFKYGEQYKFSIGLDQKYGSGTADKMLQQSKQIVKYSTMDLEDLIIKYKSLVDEY